MKSKKRPYNRITKTTIARHRALEIEYGNGSEAVRQQTPEVINERHRAWQINKQAKKDSANALEFIDTSLQQIGIDAVQRVGMMVNSDDERIATKNSHYVIDHLRGKPLQRSESHNLNLNIESIL